MSNERNGFVDKNSLWGGLNIQTRQLCVKGVLAQDLGFVCRPFQGQLGGFRGSGGEIFSPKSDYMLRGFASLTCIFNNDYSMDLTGFN